MSERFLSSPVGQGLPTFPKSLTVASQQALEDGHCLGVAESKRKLEISQGRSSLGCNADGGWVGMGARGSGSEATDGGLSSHGNGARVRGSRDDGGTGLGGERRSPRLGEYVVTGGGRGWRAVLRCQLLGRIGCDRRSESPIGEVDQLVVRTVDLTYIAIHDKFIFSDLLFHLFNSFGSVNRPTSCNRAP